MANSKSSPLYQQIFEEIKGAIEAGDYVPKERIPSEPELSERYGVSRITVRRAVEELCAEGYLVKQQGRGTFVSTPHINRRLLQYTAARSFTDVCRDSNMKPGAHVLNRLIVPVRSRKRSSLASTSRRYSCMSSEFVLPTSSRFSKKMFSCRTKVVKSFSTSIWRTYPCST